MKKLKRHVRLMVQIGWTALTNSNFSGFVKGSIYTGSSKYVCAPGLNCYSCPGARLACPIGALQAVESSPFHDFPFYVVGMLVVFGVLLGRFVCGWLCPFGLVQDLLNKIPLRRKFKVLPGDKYLRYLKYVILALFVVALPLFATDAFGQGAPWFCKYICPSGTLLAGLPLAAANPALRAAAGGLFIWKLALMLAILVLALFYYRPFCRYLCPLGALYGLFNPIALYRYNIDGQKCTSCGACSRACGFGIETYKTPNSVECIRCGDCKRACPTGAITVGPCKTKNRAKASKENA